MNCFAHSQLAGMRNDHPYFALGAMLPDWTAWIGERPGRVGDPVLEAGIRFHHACDAAFHVSARFVALVSEATRALRDAGLERGPARGAAHVGVELLLDGALATGAASGDAARAIYDSALAAAPSAAPHLVWRRPGGRSRFEAVARRLALEGPPRRFADPELVASAVARTLERRPRLRVPPDGIAAVAAWARLARETVAQDAAILLAETERGLRRRGAA